MANGLDYEKEYDLNKKFFKAGVIVFANHLAKVNGLEKLSESDINEIASDIRSAEVINSCTEDITRYCYYHHIKQNSDGVFDLSAATRAAFFTKWIMNFRPINTDILTINDSDSVINLLEVLSSDTTDSDEMESKNSIFGIEESTITSAFLCNELFSLYVADMILALGTKENRRSVFDFLKGRELKSMLYALRFRIKHQDSYTLFFNRVLNERPPALPPLALLAE